MRNLMVRWVLASLALIASKYIVGDLFGLPFRLKLDDFADYFRVLLGVAVLAFLNATVGRILKFLTFPITCLTLGLFALVINAAIFLAVGQMGFAFQVEGFLAAFIGSLVYSIMTGALNWFFASDDEKEDR
jgi:putative membrane protein